MSFDRAGDSLLRFVVGLIGAAAIGVVFGVIKFLEWLL